MHLVDLMAKLTRKQHTSRDSMRRYGQRGVARSVLENAHDPYYMRDHPIAVEMAKSMSTKKIERLATERNPVGNTGVMLMEVGCPGCEGYGEHSWPCDL